MRGERPLGPCCACGSACRPALTCSLRRAPKNRVLRCAHDELTNRCRIAQLLGPPFRYAGAGAEIQRQRGGASPPSRRDRRAEALPRLGVLLDSSPSASASSVSPRTSPATG